MPVASDAPATLPAVVERAARLWGPRIALDDGERRWTFAELRDEAQRVSRALLALGIAKGDRIAIWCPNIAEWVFAAVGLQSIGAVLVPLPNRFTGAEAAGIIRRAGVRLLFAYPELEQGAVPALLAGEALPELERVVLLRGQAEGALDWASFLALGESVGAEAVAERALAVGPDDIMDTLFTSGTTGNPKGVLCTHGQNCRVFQTWADTVGLREDDVYLVLNPFFHSFGYKAGWFTSLLVGCRIVPVFAFDMERVLTLIQDQRATMWPGAPAVYEMLLAHPARGEYDLSSLRLGVTGAAAVPVSLVRAMKEELGFETVLTAYGLTESCGVVSCCRPEDDAETISKTSGRAIEGVEVRLVDPASGQTVPAGGGEGEIWVRGYNVMRGYLDDPEATREAITAEGWLRTGDIGVMDERGYLAITDRLKDMYIMNGENVYPAEVEKVLAGLEGVVMAGVIGVPKQPQGEVGMAFVQRAPGSELAADAVKQWCRDRLASYKCPYYVEFIDALPLMPTGKIDKKQLRQLAADLPV